MRSDATQDCLVNHKGFYRQLMTNDGQRSPALSQSALGRFVTPGSSGSALCHSFEQGMAITVHYFVILFFKQHFEILIMAIFS